MELPVNQWIAQCHADRLRPGARFYITERMEIAGEARPAYEVGDRLVIAMGTGPQEESTIVQVGDRLLEIELQDGTRYQLQPTPANAMPPTIDTFPMTMEDWMIV